MNAESLRPPLLRGELTDVPFPRPETQALGRSVALAHAGAALFGIALAASHHELLSARSIAWALAIPAVLAITWLVCLPALYIPWAGREPRVGLPAVLRSAASSFATAGACLASTAPIVWFFSATAPESRLPVALAFIFTWLALISSGVVFGRALQRESIPLPAWALWSFFGLYLVTFFQFSDIAGLAWFGA